MSFGIVGAIGSIGSAIAGGVSAIGSAAGAVGSALGATGIGAAASIGSALLGSRGAQSAADAQAAASGASIDEQRRQYDLTRSDFAPYRAAGVDALGQLKTEINRPTTAADAMSDPGYQFGMQQGQLGLDRKAAAAGGRISGAALKAASEYATNYASTGYNAAYQRRQDRLNRLAALAGIGQSATGSSAQAGSAATNAITGIMGSQGDASGAYQMARNNIWGGAVNQLGAIGSRWADSAKGGYSGSTGYTGGSDPLGDFIASRGW